MKQLYYKEPYTKEWQTTVTKTDKRENKFFVQLKETCFYPEGGGQPGDRGYIGKAEVLDTRQEGELILHVCRENPGEGEVTCLLNWDFRFDYMQQHTGQHILSAVLKNELDINTVSVHQGEEYTSVETDRDSISPEEVEMINKQANQVILDNYPVIMSEVDAEELKNNPVRRPTERTGKIRLVEIGVYDRAACGGVHTATTAEVRMIHIFQTEQIRGRTKITAKIGDRILADYKTKTDLCLYFSAQLSAPLPRLQSQYEKAQQQTSETIGRVLTLEQKLSSSLVKEVSKKEINSKQFIFHCFENEDSKIVKEVVKKLLSCENSVFFIGNRIKDHLLWQVGSSSDLKFDFTSLRKSFLELVNGRGGGKAPLWQGTAENKDSFEQGVQFIETAIEGLD